MSWLALELYKLGMLKLGKFKLTSGIDSPFYIDLRQLYSYPGIIEKLIDELQLLIDWNRYDVIVGIATSGMVLATFLACKLRKPLSYVRIERKAHGTQTLVEGVLSSKYCIIIDDVATTGGTIEYAYRAIKDARGMPITALVIVDREQGARNRVESLGLKFYSYITASEMFKYLYKNNFIDERQYIEIIEYIKKSKNSS